MSGLRIEEHRGASAFEELREEWVALHRLAGASPFLSYEWLSSWHAHFGARLRPRLITARNGKELVGILPLAEERLHPGGLPITVKRLSFLGERIGGADYLDLLSVSERRVEATEAILAFLASEKSFDLLDLYEVAAESPLVPAAQRHLAERRGISHGIVPRYVCPQVELGGSWEEVLRRSRRASNFKRRLKQLGTQGFKYLQVQREDEAVQAFDRFLELHEMRWEEQGGSDGIGTPAIVAFHRDVVKVLARAGWLRFEELWVDGACRASIYGIDAGDSYFFYQSGFDPAWGSRSVGLVLLGLSMEQAVSRGVRVYDFLHGSESYKLDWATRSRQTVALRAVERGLGPVVLRARVGAEVAARSWAHTLLPGRAVEILRRVRRHQERRRGA